VDRLSKDINARRYHVPDDVWVIEWEQIKRLDMKIHEKARNLAVKYGYEEWE